MKKNIKFKQYNFWKLQVKNLKHTKKVQGKTERLWSHAAISHSDLIKEHPKEMSAGQNTESRAFSRKGT